MADIELVVTVSRTLLGLASLNINDHVNYRVAPGSFGGKVTWQRTAASSPYMDDDITVHRRRGKVSQPLILEVLAGTAGTSAKMEANLAAVVQAFCQDTFLLSVSVNGQSRVYAAEASDYQLAWTGPRFKAKQMQLALEVPTSPVPVVGVL